MMLDHLFKRREMSPLFTFDYDVDEDDRMIRLFWADSVCKNNYKMFGDVVSFDATYNTNKYVYHNAFLIHFLCFFVCFMMLNIIFFFFVTMECRYNLVFAPFTGNDNDGKIVTFGVGLINKEDANSYYWLLGEV